MSDDYIPPVDRSLERIADSLQKIADSLGWIESVADRWDAAMEKWKASQEAEERDRALDFSKLHARRPPIDPR